MTFGRSQAVIATRASRLRLRCRDARVRDHSAEPVGLLSRREAVQQSALEAHVSLEDFQEEVVQALAVARAVSAGLLCDPFQVFRNAGEGIRKERGDRLLQSSL